MANGRGKGVACGKQVWADASGVCSGLHPWGLSSQFSRRVLRSVLNSQFSRRVLHIEWLAFQRNTTAQGLGLGPWDRAGTAAGTGMARPGMEQGLGLQSQLADWD